MKRKFILIFIILVILIIGLVVKQAFHDRKWATIANILKHPNFLRIGRIVEYVDNHGGFLGDGNTYVVIEYSKDEFIKILNPMKSGIYWRDMPLPEYILNIRGLANPENHHFLKDHYLPALKDKGYYYFYDSQPEWYPNNKNINKPVSERPSFNYSLAILDDESKRLYLFREDT